MKANSSSATIKKNPQKISSHRANKNINQGLQWQKWQKWQQITTASGTLRTSKRVAAVFGVLMTMRLAFFLTAIDGTDFLMHLSIQESITQTLQKNKREKKKTAQPQTAAQLLQFSELSHVRLANLQQTVLSRGLYRRWVHKHPSRCNL